MLLGSSRALVGRVALLMLFSTALIGTTVGIPVTMAQTPAAEGRIRLIPAMSNVPGDAGPFTIYVLAEDLQHDGAITYDYDRDGTPDRSVPSQGMAAFEITVAYDPAVLAVAGVQPGPDLGRSGRPFQCLPPAREPGSLTFGCLSFGSEPPGEEGTMTLALVQFAPQASGFSPLALEAELAGPLGDNVEVTVDGGAARVTGVVPGPTTGPEDPATPPPDGGSEPGTTPEPTDGSSSLAATPQTQTAVSVATATSVAKKTAQAGGEDDPGGPGGPGDGGSLGSATLWSAVAAGSIGAGGLLMLAGMVWRQRQHRGRI